MVFPKHPNLTMILQATAIGFTAATLFAVSSNLNSLAIGTATMAMLFFLASLGPAMISSDPLVFRSNTIRIVVQALLIDILAFTIILPLFPRLLDYYDKQDGAKTVQTL